MDISDNLYNSIDDNITRDIKDNVIKKLNSEDVFIHIKGYVSEFVNIIEDRIAYEAEVKTYVEMLYNNPGLEVRIKKEHYRLSELLMGRIVEELNKLNIHFIVRKTTMSISTEYRRDLNFKFYS